MCGSDSSDDFSDLSDSSDFSDSSEFSDDFSDALTDAFTDDFSDDFSDEIGIGEPVPPEDYIPEYGSVGALDDGADACYAGDYDACDQLYFQADPGSGYRDYGDSCAGQQNTGTGVLCTDAFG